MTVEQVIAIVRGRIRDTNKASYQDSEIIGYVNDAIGFLNGELISMGNPCMVKELSVSSDTAEIPTDFVRFAGQYPLYLSGGIVKRHEATDTVTARYFAAKNNVSSIYHVIPFPDMYANVLVELVTILALNRNEFETSQDERLMGALRQVVRAAGVGGQNA